MTKGWLIYSLQDARENKAYIDWFIDEAKKQDINLDLIIREHLTVGIYQNKHVVSHYKQHVGLPEFAVVRTREPMLSRMLEEVGISVFNSAFISEICNDKARTYLEVAKLGIPMVNTCFIKQENLSNESPLPFPFVIKEVTGRGGSQVYFIQSHLEWEKLRHSLHAQAYVVQDTNVQLGKDLRVFVVGNEIVGQVLRESKKDFRANYKLGGSASWYDLNQEETNLIHTIISHFDFGMVGIDFLIDHNGKLQFNEIEDVVGSRTLSAVSDINILEKYVAHIKGKIERDF